VSVVALVAAGWRLRGHRPPSPPPPARATPWGPKG